MTLTRRKRKEIATAICDCAEPRALRESTLFQDWIAKDGEMGKKGQDRFDLEKDRNKLLLERIAY
jgi:hypothetical protein